MNQTVAIALIIWATGACIWALARAIVGPRREPSSLAVTVLAVAVMAWLATGVVAWATGSPPARPWVFAGYAGTAAAIIPVGMPLAGRLSGRQADLVRAVIFALLAFLCYRSEVVFL